MEKWKLLKTLNVFKEVAFSCFMGRHHHIILIAIQLTQIVVLLYLKKNVKVWDWLLQYSQNGLLSSTKHSDSPDILHTIYLEGFRTGKPSCQQGNVKYFSLGRVLLATAHISFQELFSLAPEWQRRCRKTGLRGWVWAAVSVPPPPPRSQCLQTLKGLPGSCRDVWRGRVMCGEALLRPFGWSTYSTRMLLTRNVPASSHHTQKLQVMAPQQICVELIYSFWSRCSLQVRGLIVAEIIRSKKPNFYIVCINMLILKK